MDPKPQTQILKLFFFLFKTTRRRKSLEGLNSSLAQFAAQLWPKFALRGQIIPFWNFFNFVKNWVFEP